MSCVYSEDISNDNITLTGNNLTKFYGEDVSFNISLHNNSKPIVGESINITLSNNQGASKIYTVTTNNEGYGFLPVNLGIGYYTAKSEYSNLILFNSIHILKNNTPYLVSTDFTENYGEGKYFTGILYDSYGNGIAGMHISLNLTRLSSGASKVYDTVTDYTGLYSLQINLAPGYYTALSSFKGLNLSNLYYAPADSVLNSIIVTRQKPLIVNGTVSLNEVIDGAVGLVDYVRVNGTLPKTIELSSAYVNVWNFIYLLSQATYNLGNNINSDLKVSDISLPSSTPINSVKGSLSKNDIISLADRLSNFINSNSRLPSYDSSNGLGSLSYENYAYILAEFLNYYKDYNILPSSLIVDTGIFYKGGISENLGDYDLTVFSWGSGGDLTKNSVIMNNIPNTNLTQKVLEECNKGTVMLSFGNGNGPSVMINAGVHGNELSSIAATFYLINKLASVSKDSINGTVYVICDLCPYTGSTSTRYFNGVNLNSVANVDGSLSNNLVKITQSLGCSVIGDFHCTQPGGDPGKDVAMGTYSPIYESSTIVNYISENTGVSSLIYSRAGSVYTGAVEDVCNLNGVTAVTCEVLTPHGTIRFGSVGTSYNMMLSLLSYKGIIL